MDEKTEKKLNSYEATLVSLDRHRLLLPKTPIITPKKRTVQPRDAFEDTVFRSGFEIVKF
jgi:hypothetical protein